jgi:hypothetical protein
MEAAAQYLEEPQELATIEQEASHTLATLHNAAEKLEIVTAEDATHGDELRGELVARRKAVEGWFAPLVDAAHKAHRQLCDRRAIALTPFAETEKIVSSKLVVWHGEQERIRREAEAAAMRAAREEAERRQIAEAEAALDAGDDDRAEAILEAPPPPVLVPRPNFEPAPKLASTAFANRWHAEVVDLMALVRAIAAGKAPLECVQANMIALNGLARSLKGGLTYPGVQAVRETGVRTTRARV